MYANYYQLGSDPFSLSPSGKQCYVHPSYKKVRSYLEYALYRKDGIVLISGDPGTGKTSMVKELTRVLDGSKTRIVSVSVPSDSLEGLIIEFAVKLGCETSISNTSELLQEIEYRLKQTLLSGGRTVLIIDEAQILSTSALEQARLFSNYMHGDTPLLQVVLVGQGQLRKKILSPDLVQLHQRIVAAAQLEPLADKDVKKYFFHSLAMAGWTGTPSFSDDIFLNVAKASRGIPRWINQIGSRLMLRGMLEEKTELTQQDVLDVISDLAGESLLPHVYRDETPNILL